MRDAGSGKASCRGASRLSAVRPCNRIIAMENGTIVEGGTHQELLKAIELNKPRWIMAHDHVVLARALIRGLGAKSAKARTALGFTKQAQLDDLRVIDMYEAATRNDVRFQKPSGNWVQKFVSDEDALRYAVAQFHRFQEVERLLEEQLKSREAVVKRVKDDQAAQAKAKGGLS